MRQVPDVVNIADANPIQCVVQTIQQGVAEAPWGIVNDVENCLAHHPEPSQYDPAHCVQIVDSYEHCIFFPPLEDEEKCPERVLDVGKDIGPFDYLDKL
jgi:hypothetical protein